MAKRKSSRQPRRRSVKPRKSTRKSTRKTRRKRVSKAKQTRGRINPKMAALGLGALGIGLAAARKQRMSNNNITPTDVQTLITQARALQNEAAEIAKQQNDPTLGWLLHGWSKHGDNFIKEAEDAIHRNTLPFRLAGFQQYVQDFNIELEHYRRAKPASFWSRFNPFG